MEDGEEEDVFEQTPPVRRVRHRPSTQQPTPLPRETAPPRPRYQLPPALAAERSQHLGSPLKQVVALERCQSAQRYESLHLRPRSCDFASLAAAADVASYARISFQEVPIFEPRPDPVPALRLRLGLRANTDCKPLEYRTTAYLDELAAKGRAALYQMCNPKKLARVWRRALPTPKLKFDTHKNLEPALDMEIMLDPFFCSALSPVHDRTSLDAFKLAHSSRCERPSAPSYPMVLCGIEPRHPLASPRPPPYSISPTLDSSEEKRDEDSIPLLEVPIIIDELGIGETEQRSRAAALEHAAAPASTGLQSILLAEDKTWGGMFLGEPTSKARAAGTDIIDAIVPRMEPSVEAVSAAPILEVPMMIDSAPVDSTGPSGALFRQITAAARFRSLNIQERVLGSATGMSSEAQEQLKKQLFNSCHTVGGGPFELLTPAFPAVELNDRSSYAAIKAGAKCFDVPRDQGVPSPAQASPLFRQMVAQASQLLLSATWASNKKGELSPWRPSQAQAPRGRPQPRQNNHEQKHQQPFDKQPKKHPHEQLPKEQPKRHPPPEEQPDQQQQRRQRQQLAEERVHIKTPAQAAVTASPHLNPLKESHEGALPPLQAAATESPHLPLVVSAPRSPVISLPLPTLLPPPRPPSDQLDGLETFVAVMSGEPLGDRRPMFRQEMADASEDIADIVEAFNVEMSDVVLALQQSGCLKQQGGSLRQLRVEMLEHVLKLARLELEQGSKKHHDAGVILQALVALYVARQAIDVLERVGCAAAQAFFQSAALNPDYQAAFQVCLLFIDFQCIFNGAVQR